MNNLLEEIEKSKEEIRNFSTTDKNSAETFRIHFLGTKGSIKNLMGEMKNVPAEKRRDVGQLLNELKIIAEEKLETLKIATGNNEHEAKSSIDRSEERRV